MVLSTRQVHFEDVLRPEFLTYRQVGDMLGVSQPIVRLLVTRGKSLRKNGNPARVPAFPSPHRVSGLPGSVVFLRSELDAFVAEREALSRQLFESLPDHTDRT